MQPAMEREWATDPFEMQAIDGYFYGRGTSDNKVRPGGKPLAACAAACCICPGRGAAANRGLLSRSKLHSGGWQLQRPRLTHAAQVPALPEAARICVDWSHACQPPNVQLQVAALAGPQPGSLHCIVAHEAMPRGLLTCAEHSSCLQGPILAFVYAVKEMLEEGRSTSTDLPVNVAFVFEVGTPPCRLSCQTADVHLKHA